MGPLITNIETAQAAITQARQELSNLTVASRTICPSWTNTTTVAGLTACQIQIKNSIAMLQPAKLYPFYSDVMHSIVCDSIVASLSWLVLSQGLVAIFGLPIVTILTTRFLRQLGA